MLTDTRIRNIKPGTKAKNVSDSRKLYLEVTPAAARPWRYRLQLDGSHKALPSGIGLTEARGHRSAVRKRVSRPATSQ